MREVSALAVRLVAGSGALIKVFMTALYVAPGAARGGEEE
jgi:hypothetical protein